jgi:hypothetical protein
MNISTVSHTPVSARTTRCRRCGQMPTYGRPRERVERVASRDGLRALRVRLRLANAHGRRRTAKAAKTTRESINALAHDGPRRRQDAVASGTQSIYTYLTSAVTMPSRGYHSNGGPLCAFTHKNKTLRSHRQQNVNLLSRALHHAQPGGTPR